MKRKRIIITVLVVLVVISSVVVFVFNKMDQNLKQLSNMEINNVNLSKIPDGVFEGSCSVFPVSVKVKVTVGNHKIKNIELIEHRNGKGNQAEVIPSKVLEKQSLDVDIVTGATYSSKAILKAIENALQKSET